MKCFLCTSDAFDNSQLTIQMEDGKKVDIYLCEVHSESSIKQLKEAYAQKKVDLDNLIKQAKELGYSIDLDSLLNPSSRSILTATEIHVAPEVLQIPIKPATQPAKVQIRQEIITEDDENMIPTEIIDKKVMRSVGGNTEMGNVSAHQSYDFNSLGDKLPENARIGKVKMAMVEGRGGQPIAIPQKRVDGLGETHIMINKAENDDKLQARFKKMAQESKSDKFANFSQNGYADTTRPCPICRGSGLVRNGKNESSCPKCAGGGMISI
jgi:hypothetical protein